jgi:DNA-directed RNA polymerase sigma subunit (sigma70/sigma32)
MTLREVAERLGISFARVKQIETQAMNKIKKRCLNKGLTF